MSDIIETKPRSLSSLIADTIDSFGDSFGDSLDGAQHQPSPAVQAHITDDTNANSDQNTHAPQSPETTEATEATDRLAFSEIVEAFHERGFGMLLLILAAPMALPLPVPPGVNIILASPLLFLTAQQAFGKHTPWLPAFILKKQVKRSLFQKTMRAILPWIKRIEKISKPRFAFITRGLFSYIIGFSGFLMALSICVPLPLTNTVPSLGICLMAAGVLMRDGLAVIAGMVLGFTWITLLLLVGEAGLRYIIGLII